LAVAFTHSASASHMSVSLHGIPSATMLGQVLGMGPPVIAFVGHDP
jgi:hypothetical protein